MPPSTLAFVSSMALRLIVSALSSGAHVAVVLGLSTEQVTWTRAHRPSHAVAHRADLTPAESRATKRHAMNKTDSLTFGQVARELRRSRRTLARFFEQSRRGRALLDRRGYVPAELVDRLPIYTAGVLARLAGCSRKTVQRRVVAGQLVPKKGPFAYDRFTRKDLRTLRASLPKRRRRSRNRKAARSVDWRA